VSEPLLRARAVSKRFAGIVALSDVSLEVDHGELVSVIGPNGAGKSTLFNCLSGVLQPDHGTVTFDGRSLDGLRPSRRARLGIARTFQRIELFGGMTVLDHLIVADRARVRRGGMWSDIFRGSAPTADELARCEQVLELVGLSDVADRPAESLSLGKGRLVELGRALMCEPRLLFLDEPSSGLDRAETVEMGTALETVRREHGTAIVLIEHDVPMVQRLASRLYVLDYGQLIASGPTEEVLADERVRTAYLGVDVGVDVEAAP
jgi:branched-chain amino acid transport system ATP-binding protein